MTVEQTITDTAAVKKYSPRIFQFHCWYCGQPLVVRKHAIDGKSIHKFPDTRTRDHVTPASMGGGKRFNLVPCCQRCNMLKGSHTLDEFTLVFFGAHPQMFWGSRLARAIEAGAGVGLALRMIPLCGTVGAIDRYDAKRKKPPMIRKPVDDGMERWTLEQAECRMI